MRFVDDEQLTHEDTERDVPNQRLIHTKFGFDIKLERRDPYGFIYVVWPKGAPPDLLSGSYSNFEIARQAVNTYLNLETFNKVVEEPVEIEKAVYKKRFRKET